MNLHTLILENSEEKKDLRKEFIHVVEKSSKETIKDYGLMDHHVAAFIARDVLCLLLDSSDRSRFLDIVRKAREVLDASCTTSPHNQTLRSVAIRAAKAVKSPEDIF